MNWLYVDIEDALQAHIYVITRAGTKASVRDFALLHSAVERPKASYDGVNLYATVFIKAAALLQSLCMNHPFTDGNKRTAWTVTHHFLWINNWRLLAKRMEAANFMIHVDNDKLNLKEIAYWLKTHCAKRK